MLLPDKNTPRDAYELPLGWRGLTCRPTLYLGLSYIGVSHFVHTFTEDVESGSMWDYLIYLGCMVTAFIMAQVLELKTRPLRRHDVEPHVRQDRAARFCNFGLGFGAGVPTVIMAGASWNGQTVALSSIAFFTAFGEVLYQTYGKNHPYKPSSGGASVTLDIEDVGAIGSPVTPAAKPIRVVEGPAEAVAKRSRAAKKSPGAVVSRSARGAIAPLPASGQGTTARPASGQPRTAHCQHQDAA